MPSASSRSTGPRLKSKQAKTKPRSTKSTSSSPANGPTPLDLTREVLDVSVTERGEFRKCRRRWNLGTVLNLEPKRPTIALDFGTGMHQALEAFYLGAGEGEYDLNAAHIALEEWDARQIAKLDDGGFPSEVYEELLDHHSLGHMMLDNYVRFDQASRVQLGDTIAVEGQPVGDPTDWHPPKGYPSVQLGEGGRLLVPIVDPEDKMPLPGQVIGEHESDAWQYSPMLSAKIDLLTLRKTPKSGLWIVDHKNVASAPNDRGLDFDDQVTGYCYVVWRWTGKIPRGVVYNVLVKQAPKPPRILKKGGLSTAKDQLTTPDMYREALNEHGLIMPGSGRIASDDHAACMEALLERGWDPFFRRFEVTRNEHELMAFERRLFAEYGDMRLAHIHEDLRYPNPSTYWCPSCPVNRICLAMEDGSDWEGIIETEYKIGDDRKAA